MNSINRCKRSLFPAALFCIIIFLVSATSTYALINEPYHVIYGLFPTANNTITLKINDDPVDSYTKGDKPAAGDYFILKVPIDSVGERMSGAYRPGDLGELYLDAETESILTVIIGERGTVQRVFLPNTPVDSDGDGILDGEDNCLDVANYGQDDANGDGEGDACDDNSDTDGDGYSDMQEYLNLQKGILDPEGYGFDPLVRNAPGGEGYEGNPAGFLIPILQLLLLDNDEN